MPTEIDNSAAGVFDMVGDRRTFSGAVLRKPIAQENQQFSLRFSVYVREGVGSVSGRVNRHIWRLLEIRCRKL